MQYYIKITQKKQTARLVVDSESAARFLLQKALAKADSLGLVCDPRIYPHQGVLARSAAEERQVVRILSLIA